MQTMCSLFQVRQIMCLSYSKPMKCKDGQSSFQLSFKLSAIGAMDVENQSE